MIEFKIEDTTAGYLKEVECELGFGIYENGNIYMELYSEEGGYWQPYMALTCNFEEVNAPYQVCIKNWSENEGIEKQLIEAGIIEDLVAHKATGYVSCPVYTLSQKAIKEMEEQAQDQGE